MAERDNGAISRRHLTRVSFTHLDKVLYPALQITKAKVIEFYIRAAPRMLSYLEDRAIVLNRFPDGVGEPGFYEKDAPAFTPPWVKTFRRYSETADRDVNYIVCNDLDTLIWLANLAAIEINMPLSRIGSYESPDMAFFDIDPEPPASFIDGVNAAFLLKEVLDAIPLRSYVKTSGKKGLHVVVPVVPGYQFSQTREFVHRIGRELERKSGSIVAEFPRSREPGTVFIDYLQNTAGKTMIAPYSLRATDHATVSTPVTWEELKLAGGPEDFNITTVMERREDPWKGIFKDAQRLVIS